MATKKLEKVMSQKAVKGAAKKAGDKGAPVMPWTKTSEAESAGGKKKKVAANKSKPGKTPKKANKAGEPDADDG